MITDEKRWRIIQNALHEKQLEKAFTLLRGERVEPLLIKGWAAVRYYPTEERRYLGDIDLCIAPEQFEKALKLFRKDQGGIPVDIHKGLRHYDTLPLEDLIGRSKLVRLGETDIRVLSDEDHIRVLAVHWLNDGGAYQEKLKDIHFTLENRAEDFDWKRCLDTVDERRRRWIVCALLLSHKYLGTNIKDTPLEREKELPRWLIRAVEREWSNPVRLRPVLTVFQSPKKLWQQFRKRIPPNPVQATIELGGDFDRYPRAVYQTADVFYRIYTTIKRKRTVSLTRKLGEE